MLMYRLPSNYRLNNVGCYYSVLYPAYICCYSYVWGAIADSKGRKVVLITSGVLSGLSSGAFGFSTTYVMAIATRFLLGLFNG